MLSLSTFLTRSTDGRGGYHFLGNKSGRSGNVTGRCELFYLTCSPRAGNHIYYDPYYTIDETPVKLNTVVTGEGMVVENGTKWIVVVPQVNNTSPWVARS